MTHTCHALLCKNPCPPRMLCCRGCWALVSPETQAEVYRTVRLRGPDCDHTWAAWWRASHQAIHEIAVAKGQASTPEEKAKGERWLAHQMKIADDLERDR